MGDYSYTYDADARLVVARHRGRWNLDQSEPALEQIRALCRQHGTGRVLMDHRLTDVSLSTFDAFDRGRSLTEGYRMAPVARLAFVHAAKDAEHYSFLGTVMSNRGVRVRAFVDDVDAAMAWLINEPA